MSSLPPDPVPGPESADHVAPLVSIALLARNGMDTLPAVLDAIAAQEIAAEVEVVAVDTGSTDGTSELLEDRADRLIRIRPEDFNHGLTRNLAIEQTRGELIALLVQDAVPCSPHWLAELVAPFARDEGIAGTFARQLPRPDASRLTRWSLGRWVAARSQPRVSSIEDPAAWSVMPAMDRFHASVFDNVSSCVRRPVWQLHPFRATPIAEDLQWGRDVLLAGHCLALVPSAAVIHSHERSARYELGRTYLVHRRLHQLFGVRTIPSLPHLLRAVAVNVAQHCRVLRRGDGPRPGPREVARALALAVAWPLGQYLGGRAAAAGRDLLRPRGI